MGSLGTEPERVWSLVSTKYEFFYCFPCSKNICFHSWGPPDPSGCVIVGWFFCSKCINCWDVVPRQGLGRRRIEGSLPNTQNLIDWIPLKEELQRERPLISSYQSDFRSKDKVPQVLVHHTYESLKGRALYRTPSTTYQRTYKSYCLGAPVISVVSEKEVAKEPESVFCEPAKPVSCEPAPPEATEPTAPAEPRQPPDTTECPNPEAPAPVPAPGSVVSHKPRLTVYDCLRWHNC